MKKARSRLGTILLPRGFFTPRGLLVRGVVLVLLFGLVHLLGLREHTSVFSLTTPIGGSGLSLALGSTYAVLYLLCTLVAPVLLLGGLLLLLLLLLLRRGHATGSSALLVLLLLSSPARANIATRADGGGDAVYRAACASCHGDDGRGAARHLVGFEKKLPDFTDCGFNTREPNADWGAVVHDGGPARGFDRRMPAFGEALNEAEIEESLETLRAFCRERPSWPRGELNFARALVTEKAFPEDEAVLHAGVATESQGAVMAKLIYEHRIASRGQIEVRVPLGVRELDEGGWRAGLGDIGLGTKWVLLHSLRSGSILSLGGEAVLPTGDRAHGFGSGVVILEPFLAFGQRLPARAFVHLQVGSELSMKPGSKPHALFWRGALGMAFNHKRFYRSFTPIIEVLGDHEFEDEASTKWDLVPQVQVTISRRKHLMAAVGVRVPVEGTGRKPEVMFYLLWDWFDGGLAEGW